MNDPRWQAVDRYFDAQLLGTDPVLQEALAASTAAGLPAIQVAPNQGRFLEILARLQRARRILEVGTLGGYSTIHLARALPADGYLLTLELEPRHAEVARTNLARARLAARTVVQVGPALTSLRQLIANQEPAFDLVFIDADKPGNPDYLTAALALTRSGSLIIIDNVVRGGQVAEAASTDANVRGVRQMTDLIAREPRLCATTLQLVGTKGYDGMCFAFVR